MASKREKQLDNEYNKEMDDIIAEAPMLELKLLKGSAVSAHETIKINAYGLMSSLRKEGE